MSDILRPILVLFALLAGIATTAVAVTPGEATDLLVGRDASTGDLTLQFDPACDAVDHHVEMGPLEDVSFHGYSGQVCGIGVSGSYAGFSPGPGSWFFLVVGDDGSGTEGSYGTSTATGFHVERPEGLLDPSCAFVQDLSERCDIPTVDLTAYRPQSESYGAPLQRRAIPEGEELAPGVGVRINGDDDNGNTTPDDAESSVAGENDLIEVTLSSSMPLPPDGLEYALLRTNGDIRLWSSSTKGTELFGASDDVPISFGGGSVTAWAERSTIGTSSVTLVVRRTRDGSVVGSDELSFFAFTSVVIALGGEDQVPDDPPNDPGNHGTFEIAIDLYEMGYDVHMYDEDVVANNGSGSAYNEVVSAVQDRGVESIAIFGYSHGGGSTADLSGRLDQNRASIGTFSIDFTGYMDGIGNSSDIDISSETQLPPSTQYHANYYQGPCGFLSLCGAAVPGATFDLNVNTTVWGAGLGHFTVDDAPEVTGGIIDQLTSQVAP